MAGPVTEFACMALKPGIDSGSDGYEALEKTALTAVSQPGAQRVYWASGIEDPTRFWLFLDWNSIEDHFRFQKSEAYGPVLASLEPILDFTKTFIKHIDLSPASILESTQSGVTEVLTLFFPSDLDAAGKDVANDRLREFTEKALNTCPDVKHTTFGWSVETDILVTGEDGKTGCLLVAFIGWPSVEAHMKFRESQQFKDNIALLRTAPNLVKMSLFHVSLKSVAASGTGRP